MTSKVARDRLRLGLILALGFLLRIIGIHFGLPDLFHADEPIVVHHALAYGAGDLNPHFFKIPPFTSYLLFIMYGFYFLGGKLLGLFAGREDFLSSFLRDPSSFYLLGRLLFGAVLGTATIWALYGLIKRFFERELALLSAFFLAVSFLHVRDSHYIYADIPLILILLLCFFPLFQILKKPKPAYYIVFGFLAGIAIATKYNGLFIFLPLFVTPFLKTASKRQPLLSLNLFLSLIAAFITYSVLNPFSWIDLKFFLSELKGQSGSEGFSGFLHHLIYSLNGGLGFPLLTLAIYGIALAFFERDLKKYAFMIFIFSYYGVLCFFSQPYDRYALPLIPFFAFFAADGLIQIKKRFQLSHASVLVVSFALVLPSIAKIYRSDYLFLQKDVRTVAREWVEESIPKNTKIALDSSFYVPRLKPTVAQLREKQSKILASPHGGAQARRLDLMIKQAEADEAPRYELFFLEEAEDKSQFLFAKPNVPPNVETLRKLGIRYVITYQDQGKRREQFMADLEQRATLMEKFTPYKDKARERVIDPLPLTGGPFLWNELAARERNGYIIKVYRLK